MTRESLSGGIRSASAVSHQMSNSARPIPAIRFAGYIMTSVTPAAYTICASGRTPKQIIARRIGYSGRHRIAISDPMIVPAPSTAATAP